MVLHLARQTFTLITDQRSLAFMLDNRRRTKIKNDTVQLWCMEFAPLLYIIQYRPGQKNVAPVTFTPAYCSATTVASLIFSCVLQDIRDELCYPGVTCMLNFIESKNLPYSTTDVKMIARYVLALNPCLFEETKEL